MTGEEINEIVEDTKLKTGSVVGKASVTTGALVLVPENTCFPDSSHIGRILGTDKVVLAGCGQKSQGGGCKCRNVENGKCARSQLDLLESFEGVYLFSPGFAMMQRIIQLCDDELVVRMLLQAVLCGKRAGIVFQSDSDSLPPGIRRQLKKVSDDLESLGITINYGNGSCDTDREQKEATTKTLLLEEDIIALHKEGKTMIHLDKKSIVSPLAADKASELGIQILKK